MSKLKLPRRKFLHLAAGAAAFGTDNARHVVAIERLTDPLGRHTTGGTDGKGGQCTADHTAVVAGAGH